MTKISKRAVPILILVTLALSLLPAVTVSAVDLNPVPPPASGSYGDKITVSGSGVTAGQTVNLYWDYVQAWDGAAGLINSTTAKPAGTFSMKFTVPEAVEGVHYLWVKDMDTGAVDPTPEMFTVIPMIELDPDEGLYDDTITISGYGFNASVDIDPVSFYNGTHSLDITPATIPETDDVGSFTASFKVPGPKSAWVYALYTVEAEDEAANIATAAFEIGPAVTISPAKGPTGSVLDISGRGFTAGQILSTAQGNITINGAVCGIVGDEVTIESDGTFSGEIVIPFVKATGKYIIDVTDFIWSSDVDFEVDGLPSVSVDPVYGPPGSTISVQGENFTQIEDTVVDLQLTKQTDKSVYDVGDVETNADGTFSGTFTAPAVEFENYWLNATDDYFCDAFDPFKVGIIALIIQPTSGPTGTAVSVTGSGFHANGEYNCTFGDILVLENYPISAVETLADTFYVPTVEPGSYDVTVLDDVGNELSTPFVVTETTILDLPPEAPVHYNITIHGENFAEKAGADLDWAISNSTWSAAIPDANVTFEGAGVDVTEHGNFTGYYKIPSILLLGNTYTINATDDEGLFANATITIVEEETEISPNAESYSLGDTITFTLKATFEKVNSYIQIEDPDGVLYFEATFAAADWTKVGDWMVVQIRNQVDDASGYPFIIPTDAPTGTWSWSLYDKNDELVDGGTIEVLPTTAEQVDERLGALEEGLTGLSDDVSGLALDLEGLAGDVSGLASDVAGLSSDVAGLSSDMSSVKDSVSDIADTASSAKNAADAAKTSADAAKGAADEAKTAASGLSSLVWGAIGASLIAAVVGIFSLMQISRRIAG